MSEFKKGELVRVVKRECGHMFDIGEVVKIVGINEKNTDLRCESKVSQSWFLQFHEVEKVDCLDSEYKNSNRYKLHKAASATGFSFSKLSRAMGFSDTYISNESKESRFNRRGDLTDNRYNHLIDKLAIAERTLKGDAANTVDDSVDIEAELLCMEKRFELEPKKVIPVAPIYPVRNKVKSKTEVNKSVVWFILFIIVVVILMLITGIYKSIF